MQMPGQNAGHYCYMQKLFSKTLERENDARSFVNSRFSKQKLVNVCQSMENYFYICAYYIVKAKYKDIFLGVC